MGLGKAFDSVKMLLENKLPRKHLPLGQEILTQEVERSQITNASITKCEIQ